MNTHSLIYYGNPLLRKKAEPLSEITEETKKLIEEMVVIMRKFDGCGLAAPQIGVSLRIFILSIPFQNEKGEWQEGPIEVFINPTLLKVGDKKETLEEGCLSIPYLKGSVTRPLEVEIEAMDLNGNLFRKTFTEWHARAVFHENDHLNGVLYIDRVSNRDKKRLEPLLKKIKKKYETS